jgi:virulence-associated protein VagC
MPTEEAQTMKEAERRVRLFRNGRNQALRIPRELELEGERRSCARRVTV